MLDTIISKELIDSIDMQGIFNVIIPNAVEV